MPSAASFCPQKNPALVSHIDRLTVINAFTENLVSKQLRIRYVSGAIAIMSCSIVSKFGKFKNQGRTLQFSSI